MKIVITGHTSGIGKCLYDKFITFGHEVIGVSRTTGYDLNTDVDRVVELAENCDLFVNNCYVGASQKELLEKFLVILSPYAPHICEELWHAIGNHGSVLDTSYPVIEEKYLVEATKEYPIAINGKTRTTINLDVNLSQADVEALVMQDAVVLKWLEGNTPKKIIYVKNKMINIVM